MEKIKKRGLYIWLWHVHVFSFIQRALLVLQFPLVIYGCFIFMGTENAWVGGDL